MAATITGTVTSTYTLSNSSNPLTVAATGAIEVDSVTAGVAGILGPSGTSWSVSNQGTVASTGNNGVGIKMLSAGVVTNAASAVIAGSLHGIAIGVGTAAGAGTVDNSGTIISTGTTAGAGVNLGLGGTVTNETGGLITAYHTGIAVNGAAGTIVNRGTVAATGSGTNGGAVYLGAGGTVTNYGLLSGANGMPVTGTVGGYPGVVEAQNVFAVVRNFGTIVDPTNANGVNLLHGGLLVNGATNVTSAVINAPHDGVYMGGRRGTPYPGVFGTVINYGTIQNTSTLSAAARFAAGGIVTNRNLITSARVGVSFHNTFGTVDNFGVIASTAPAAGTFGAGIYLESGGSITNEAGATITALRRGIQIGGTTSAYTTVVNRGTISGTVGVNISNADTGGTTIFNYGTIASTAGTSGVAVRLGGGPDTLVIEQNSVLQGGVGNLGPGDTIDLPWLPYDSSGSVTILPNNVLQITEPGGTFQMTVEPGKVFGGFTAVLKQDGGTGTALSIAPAATLSPAVLDDFGWQQGWGSPDNPRMLADVNGDGQTDYVGFGYSATFIAYGGVFQNSAGLQGPGFAPVVAAVTDFGSAEGYVATAQRGAAATGFGVGDSLYGQGFAGVWWYGATGESAQMDAAGNTYQQLQYQTTPTLYGNFGTAQGWTPDNGFQILKANASDPYASILGFGDAGIVVGPQAFAPGATAANSYVIPFQAGNNFGWSQSTDIRTFTDVSGNTIDLNGDGVADFVGMGPQGLVFALGNTNGPGGAYGLGALQSASIGSVDLGDDQGWSNQTTPRAIVYDPQTGYDDIIAFGAAGTYVAMGQDPAAHGGQPFGQLTLAMADFGSNQGWSATDNPRLVGDVNGDGIPDLVGFGINSTFVAIGARDAGGNLTFALDPSQTIPDFGSSEGWSGTDPGTLRALGNFTTGGASRADLVLSGAFNTQLWQFTPGT